MDWSLSQYVRDLGETEELQVLHHQQKRRKLLDQVKYLFDVSIRYLRMVPIHCWSNFSGMEHQKSNYSQSDTWAQMLNWTSRHPENKDTASDSPRYVGGEIGLILVSVNSPRWSIGIDIEHKKNGIKPSLVSLQGSPKSEFYFHVNADIWRHVVRCVCPWTALFRKGSKTLKAN